MKKVQSLLSQQHCTTTLDLGVFMTTLLLRHSQFMNASSRILWLLFVFNTEIAFFSCSAFCFRLLICLF